jgi:catechol 2,3-dioxygenase-like lactoylglutathione lyase family enzyme
MDHLALAVTDQDRSRRFYETYLGFDAEPAPRSDGVPLLYNAAGFSLALGPTDEPIQLPEFLHFGLSERRARRSDLHRCLTWFCAECAPIAPRARPEDGPSAFALRLR